MTCPTPSSLPTGETSKYGYLQCFIAAVRLTPPGRIRSKGSRERRHSGRHTVQGWRRASSGEARHKQAPQAGREQEDSHVGQEHGHCERASRSHRAGMADNILQVSSGLLPDGRHFVSRARDEAAQWRQLYKAPIPVSSLADRMGSYAQAYTLYSSVRPFGITAIIAGWDSEAELPVDGQVGSGPKVGSGGKKEGAKHGGPSLYMIEPSGLYWVRRAACQFEGQV